MKARTCAALTEVVTCLQSIGMAFALVHESALMGWGIDNNMFLDRVDVLLLDDGGFRAFGANVPTLAGQHVEVQVSDVPTRLWSRESLRLAGSFDVTACKRYGCEALAPELVLKKLPFSPDIYMLAEQRARLASILFADDLTEEELSLVARYVRGN